MFKRISSPFRKSKQRSKVVFENRAPDNIEYIVVLPHSIFTNCGIIAKIKLFLTRKYIAHLQDNIVGKLHVVSQFAEGHPKCNCCNIQHQVCDFIQQNSLLLKLPKENMFVPIQDWDSRYCQSKISELTDLMMYLGASEIEYQVINNNSSSDAQGINFDVSAYGVNVGGGVAIEKEESSLKKNFQKIIFQKPSMNIQKINDGSNFHYLSQNHDWQHMINQRLNSCISSYDIKTQITERISINKSAKICLEKLSVQVTDNHAVSHNSIMTLHAKFMEFDSAMSPKTSDEILLTDLGVT